MLYLKKFFWRDIIGDLILSNFASGQFVMRNCSQSLFSWSRVIRFDIICGRQPGYYLSNDRLDSLQFVFIFLNLPCEIVKTYCFHARLVP